MRSPIEPYETGMLDTGDGNLVYWEACVNPDQYRIVLFDQRNSGRSTPHASDPAADMSFNTTEHLISDMEQLREHLGVDKWLLRGGS